MGLDMYLTKKTYLLSDDARNGLKLTIKGGLVDSKRVVYVAEELGYWRKANAIHQWFVDNVQGGHDDCGEYSVSREQLQELLDTVKEVLAASKLIDGTVICGYTMEKDEHGKAVTVPIKAQGKLVEDPTVAQELLPTASGFFFGGTDYDEYYVECLRKTHDIVAAAIGELDGDTPQGVLQDVKYSSSW